MASLPTAAQLKSLETVERVASCFSIIGTVFIFITFLSSPNFRKPINRLVFYASWGNILCNIATLMSQSGIRAGQGSHLCQFQGFLIQMFVPADAFWNLAMAINVYLTLFRNYNAQQLKALEWKYQLMCYGVPFVIALTCVFIETRSRGMIYGPAMLWCWISTKWAFLRVALCYGPAWICIAAAFTIYVMAGREVFRKRQELRDFSNPMDEPHLVGYKTTDVQITSEPAKQPRENLDSTNRSNRSTISGKSYEQYTVKIASGAISPRPHLPYTTSAGSVYNRTNRATMEANTAAWGYTKVALLFFVSLLVTWAPSSVNRLNSLIHPNSVSISLTYTAGTVLSLMGFWNSVIYITTSRAACKSLFLDLWQHRQSRGKVVPRRRPEDRRTIGSMSTRVDIGSSDSKEAFAAGEDMV